MGWQILISQNKCLGILGILGASDDSTAGKAARNLRARKGEEPRGRNHQRIFPRATLESLEGFAAVKGNGRRIPATQEVKKGRTVRFCRKAKLCGLRAAVDAHAPRPFFGSRKSPMPARRQRSGVGGSTLAAMRAPALPTRGNFSAPGGVSSCGTKGVDAPLARTIKSFSASAFIFRAAAP